MKKIALIIVSFLIFMESVSRVTTPVIPDDSFRFRIIANSNSNYDQQIKKNVRLRLSSQLSLASSNFKSTLDAEEKLISMLPSIENVLDQEVPYSYNISIGQNFFPEKIYKGKKYREGYYESMVITLGDGLGDNWWCVLFPPFCMLDATEIENDEDVEYGFFFFDFLNSFF